jgi:hypothetical protein
MPMVAYWYAGLENKTLIPLYHKTMVDVKKKETKKENKTSSNPLTNSPHSGIVLLFKAPLGEKAGDYEDT